MSLHSADPRNGLPAAVAEGPSHSTILHSV